MKNTTNSLIPVTLSLLLLLSLSAPLAATQGQASYQEPGEKLLVSFSFEGDYLQIEELAARIRAEVVRFDPPLLFLLIDEARLIPLRKEGLDLRLADPQAFKSQLIRVEPASDEIVTRVRGLGGHLIQREKSYAVFRVNLQQLETLRRQEIAFRPFQEGDLVHRFVEIQAADRAAADLVIAAGVDVFEARDGVIFGRAFDDQIETLTRHGLAVKVVSPPAPRPEGPKGGAS